MTPPEIQSAMVLAAGFGTRMRPLTDHLPKPLIPVAGRTMLDRTLDLATAAGVRRAVVNLHYLGPMIRAHLAPRAAPEIAFSEEMPEILETGGGIVRALPLLGNAPFYAINSDAVWAGGSPFAALAALWDPERMDALLLLVPRKEALSHAGPGDFFLDRKTGIPARRGDAATAPFVYTGAQIIRPEVFARAPSGPFSVNLIWDRLLAAGRLRATVFGGLWADVGTPAGLAAAEAALAARGEEPAR